ncbi:MAG TPA: hypothetical protein VKU01_15170 [Bryobacteraceae bacterium]|nr:hypothetical protein [Bryobacteraceae bacterium]
MGFLQSRGVRFTCKVVVFILLVFWFAKIVYMGCLLIVNGPKAAIAWLYHITPPLLNRGLAVPTTSDVVVTQCLWVLLTLLFWKGAGYRLSKLWRWRVQSHA